MSLLAAGALAGLAGIVIGLPALRLTGIYLAIATIAFGFIVQEVLTRWESVTRGNSGITVKSIAVGSFEFDAEWKLYYLALGLLVLAMAGVMNLLRAPTGRAFVAIRDSEISAQSMGIHLARTKTTAFALSAALTGIAGALYAHKLVFVSPEQFGILLSIELAMMIFIGGIGSLHGAVYGAIFLIALPQPFGEGSSSGRDRPPDRPGADGVRSDHGARHPVEPLGIYGRWLKMRHYLETFPLYKKDSFRRQKTFMKSERLVSPMSLLRVENLSISFGGVKAVDGVGFEVNEGEVFTIIGPNGAGKTTVFNLISRIYPPTSGRMLFGDTALERVAPHRVAGLGIARTFQNIELFEHATVLDNLLIGRHCHRSTGLLQELLLPAPGAPRGARRPRGGREGDRSPRSRALPRSARRRPAVRRAQGGRARARARGAPKLLLLDEPSSGLNTEETDDMAWWIRDIKEELGVTVLMIEHDMGLVGRVSDRVLALNYGK